MGGPNFRCKSRPHRTSIGQIKHSFVASQHLVKRLVTAVGRRGLAGDFEHSHEERRATTRCQYGQHVRRFTRAVHQLGAVGSMCDIMGGSAWPHALVDAVQQLGSSQTVCVWAYGMIIRIRSSPYDSIFSIRSIRCSIRHTRQSLPATPQDQ